MARWLSADGVIHQMTKQGSPERAKDVTEINRRKQICLKCTSKECKGTKKCFDKKYKGNKEELSNTEREKNGFGSK